MLSVNIFGALLFHKALAVFHVVVVLNPVVKGCIVQLLQLKLVLVVFSHVVVLSASVQVRDQVDEFSILRVFFERGDGYAVGKLQSKRVDCVVHEQNVFNVYIFEDPQVLDILATLGFDTSVAIEAMLD